MHCAYGLACVMSLQTAKIYKEDCGQDCTVNEGHLGILPSFVWFKFKMAASMKIIRTCLPKNSILLRNRGAFPSGVGLLCHGEKKYLIACNQQLKRILVFIEMNLFFPYSSEVTLGPNVGHCVALPG